MATAIQSLLPHNDVPVNAYSVSHPTQQPLHHLDLPKKCLFGFPSYSPTVYHNHIDILNMILLVIFLVSRVLYIVKLINQCIQNCGGGGSEIDQQVEMMQPGGGKIDQHVEMMQPVDDTIKLTTIT